MNPRWRLGLWAMLAAGVILRLAVIIHNGHTPRHDLFPGMDEVNYRELAENLRTERIFAAWTGGFLTRSTRSPGYPVALAAAEMLSAGSSWTAPALNLLLDLLNLALVFLLAGRWYGAHAAGTAAALYALFGPVFLYLPLATPEILSVTLVLLICLGLAQLRTHYWRTAPAVAVLFAWLIHTRPVFLLLLPALGLAAWLELAGSAWRNRLIRATLLATLALILCLPWGIRNWRLHQAIVPVCVTAGWHLVNRAQTTADLSVSFLTDYIYEPAHAKFAEGDYYREGMKLSGKLFRHEPFRVLGNGCLRVIHGWILPQTPWRWLLPRAYIRPVYFGSRWFVPVPDAEGLLYLFLALSAVAIYQLKRDWLKAMATWFRPARAALLLLAAYAAAHVLGFPLIQYRFIVEPLLLILGVGLAITLLTAMGWLRVAPASCEFRNPVNLLPTAATIALLSLLLFALPRSASPSQDYDPVSAPAGYIGYAAARQRQWQFRGELPPDTRAALAGVIKYRRTNLRFPSGQAAAVPDEQSAVAMLYVRYADRCARSGIERLGDGDCKLNLPGQTTLRDGDAVFVQGTLHTGAYKDLILDVESWQKL